MESKVKSSRVAVIGLGITGVATVKNLVEIGFDAVGFDQNDWIGGLWHWSNDAAQTTVLKNTRANITKQRSCYQDFPFPEETPNYPSGEDITTYIENYASKFELHGRFRLGVKIDRCERSEDGTQWTIKSSSIKSGTSIERFDRVVITTGPFHKPFLPKVEGSGSFKGRLLHAQAFKDAGEFAGKRVIVVGLSNTGGDIAVNLSKVAETTYMSCRSGARIMSRAKEGEKPPDHKISRRMFSFGQSLGTLFPAFSTKLGGYMVERMMIKKNAEYQSSWGLLPAPPITNSTPIINDYIISCFASGSVIPVKGLRRFLPSKGDDITSSSVELADGTVLDRIDAVIFSTGYYADFSILAPKADPTAFPTPEWDASPHVNGLSYPRLYQGMFSTTHPDSLAFIGPYRGHSFAAFSNADLNAQAVAQIWAGHFPLPPKSEIEAWCDANYRASLKQIQTWRIMKVGSDAKSLERWLNEAAGTQVNEKLGWGLEGWKFWWKDREMYKMIMNGVDTPFVYRLFEGRAGARKSWDGAREEIYKINGKSFKPKR